MSKRVKEILSWYSNDNAGTLANIARLLNQGRLAGTGKLVILPVDQGFEHGPARSFAPNPLGYDPRYHFELAIDAGCNAYAAPLGFLEAGAAEFAGDIPLILKLNNSDSLYGGSDPAPAVTGCVDDALRLGASAIGFTIYPASAARNEMYEQIRELSEEARYKGLATVIWSYPRGSGVSKEGETAIDVVAYAAQIAAQLGAHIIKVKPPTDHIEQDAARKVYEKEGIPVGTLADRVRHVVQSAFNGRRIVIFSGGPAKGRDEILEEVRGIAEGGGLRLDHGTQLLPAPQGSGHRAPSRGDGPSTRTPEGRDMQLGAGSLADLARLREFRRCRLSSWDRSGGNADALSIAPGETASLGEIEGAGCVKHLWVTLMTLPPDPHELLGAVLRMWWDGEASPSVEVPVGDFFGVGFGMRRNFCVAAAPDEPRGRQGHELLVPHALRPTAHASRWRTRVRPP